MRVRGNKLKDKIKADLYRIMKKSAIQLQMALLEGDGSMVDFWQKTSDADIERFLKVEFGGKNVEKI